MLRTDDESLTDANMKTEGVNFIHLTPLPEGAQCPSFDNANDGNNNNPSSSNPREGGQQRLPSVWAHKVGASSVGHIRISLGDSVRESERNGPFAIQVPSFVVGSSRGPSRNSSSANQQVANDNNGGNGNNPSERNPAGPGARRIAIIGVGPPGFAVAAASARIFALIEEMEATQATRSAQTRQSSRERRLAQAGASSRLTFASIPTSASAAAAAPTDFPSRPNGAPLRSRRPARRSAPIVLQGDPQTVRPVVPPPALRERLFFTRLPCRSGDRQSQSA